ncbi:hypothetical protein [Tianweitania sediminis]|uniref:Uncharacterized protein n=1 Tax=Tianweitania sediminis TaxID=1502156 RepID=A0A8J7R1U6_9HYPH|nr:hypothetical protein [Tianweitania sediminis]MBP0439892.1 hypothetical protein [Tianweitania sediminis]
MPPLPAALRAFWRSNLYLLRIVGPVIVMLLAMFVVLHEVPHHMYGKDWHKAHAAPVSK